MYDMYNDEMNIKWEVNGNDATKAVCKHDDKRMEEEKMEENKMIEDIQKSQDDNVDVINKIVKKAILRLNIEGLKDKADNLEETLDLFNEAIEERNSAANNGAKMMHECQYDIARIYIDHSKFMHKMAMKAMHSMLVFMTF